MKYKRKSNSEIAQIKKRLIKESIKPQTPLMVATVTILLSFLFGSFFPSRFQDPEGPSLEVLYFSLAFGVGAFLIVYLKQIITRRDIGDDSYFGICNKCYKTSHDGKKKCKCGGKFESHEFYEYR